ncbi:O-antigen polymerase [Deinococcus roseus]|uniref:O-antigen polymerase n=1 Tax=Deinococcus roseus TaxID=392414 RepID=UPI001663D953|nr:O-antigen polymerase [Deinococcus roseus]
MLISLGIVLAIALISTLLALNTNLTIILLSSLSAFLLIVLEYRRTGTILSLGGFFVVSWYTYNTAVYINNFGQDVTSIYPYAYLSTALSFMALFSFYGLYYAFSRGRGQGGETLYNNNYDNTMHIFAVIYGYLGLLFQVYFVFFVYGFNSFVFTSRSQRNLNLNSGDILALPFNNMISVSVVILLYLYFMRNMKKSGRASIILLVFGIAYSLMIVDRSSLMLYLMPTIVLLNKRNILKLQHIILIGLGLLVFFTGFKAIMNIIILNANAAVSLGLLDDEFEVWHMIMGDLYRDLSGGGIVYQFGKSYLATLMNLVVPFTDYTPLSQWYVQTYHYDVQMRGGGFGFSSIAEAFLNFGFAGILFYFGFLGIVLGIIERKARSNTVYAIVGLALLPLIYKFFRSESYSLIKVFWWSEVLPIFIFILISRFIFNRQSRKQ